MIPLQKFGNTGHKSTRTIFGAFALSESKQDEADKVLELLFEYGINHIDTAASYGDSEIRVGPWMKEHRKKFFLATKTGKRTYKEAKEELHQSLDRLNTDYIDLWQMHYLVNGNEWETAMREGGAIEAFIEAKEQGLVKHIGVTGHGLAAPTMHLKSLERYPFDSVLLPYNYILMQNETYAKEFIKLEKKCVEQNIAIQTIKAIAKGRREDQPKNHNTWYEPIVAEMAQKNAVNWVLSNENVFLNTAGDIKLLAKTLQIASQTEMAPSDMAMISDIKELGITPLFTTAEN